MLAPASLCGASGQLWPLRLGRLVWLRLQAFKRTCPRQAAGMLHYCPLDYCPPDYCLMAAHHLLQTRKVETAGQRLAARQRTLPQAGGAGAAPTAERQPGGSAQGSDAESLGEEEEEQGALSDAE